VTSHASPLARVFDAYQNLSQISRCIALGAAQLGVAHPRVLELSRRPTGLDDYVTGDVERVATHRDDQSILATVLPLPFADGEFDACVVTDAYEHIDASEREALLAEMVRVTRGLVLLGCPQGDEVVTRFDRLVFDFVWGKYGEAFEPLQQHDDLGLEPVDDVRKRFLDLGATDAVALPCNYVYRWIHQILVYFDVQHRHPRADLFEPVNRAYNELLSPLDAREPCYRYLLLVPTDDAVDVAAITEAMATAPEVPASVREAEGVLIDAFREFDGRTADLLRSHIHEVQRCHEELDRLRAVVASQAVAELPAAPRLVAPLDRRRERATERALRDLAEVTAALASRLAPEPDPIAPPATPDPGFVDAVAALTAERDELRAALATIDVEARALLGSRRWRVGSAAIDATSLLRRHAPDELAATRLVRVLDDVAALPVSPAVELAATPEPEPEPEAEPDGLVAWPAPGRRRYDVVVLANVDWHTRKQRPHQLARAFARHGHRVFYVVASRWLPEDHPRGYELEEVDEGVVEVVLAAPQDPERYRRLAPAPVVERWRDAFDRLADDLGIEHAAVHVHLQSWLPLLPLLRDDHGWKLLYDCMDEWQGFPGMGDQLSRCEHELVSSVDLVAVTAATLLEKWAPVAPRSVLVRNGVDAEWFEGTAGPSDLLLDDRGPVLCFTGGIAEWVDVELLAEVARRRPDWTLVLVGDVFVDDLAGLDTLPNVRLTGLRPHAEMPVWLAAADVALIPFRVDEVTAAVDPVKFYEYVSLGTPVVTTPLPELDEHRDHVYVARGPDEFVAAVESALVEPQVRRFARRSVAIANTWDDRYAVLDTATRRCWPLVSIVVVTHGRLDLTRRCLETLLGDTTWPRFEVIVVDNASPDGTVAYLRHLEAHDQRLRVIHNDANRGFAAANNQGLAVAGGDVLVLLNNDTEVAPGWLEPLLGHLDDPSVGLVGPRSDNVGNEARIPVGDLAEPGALAALTARRRDEHAGRSFDIHMLGMFCVAMRRSVHAAIGPLDEGYGIGMFEDDDYAERVREAGLRIVCAEDAFVRHVGQGTFAGLIERGEYDALWATNLARFEARWGPWHAQ
jgi:GT2 family glycosyltransferase/glycosyltransferase involved in cell wall biosynthesis